MIWIVATRAPGGGTWPTRRMSQTRVGAAMLVVSSESEGFGLPCLEAMAQEVPVVTVAGGALPEVAGTAALVVPSGDDDALASAIVRVERDEGVAADLVNRGRARAAAATWSASAERLRRVLGEAANGR